MLLRQGVPPPRGVHQACQKLIDIDEGGHVDSAERLARRGVECAVPLRFAQRSGDVYPWAFLGFLYLTKMPSTRDIKEGLCVFDAFSNLEHMLVWWWLGVAADPA